MDNSELVGELLQALTNDVQALGKKVDALPTGLPPDYGARLTELTTAVQALRHELTQRAAPDDRALIARLDRMESRQTASPTYVMSQAVRYGVVGFWLLVVALGVTTWYCLDWKAKADHYLTQWTEDNWRVRYTEQANPAYYATMEGFFAKDAAKVRQWTYDQEQADEKRVLAQQAARQAQALRQQASQLERGKGSKASRR